MLLEIVKKSGALQYVALDVIQKTYVPVSQYMIQNIFYLLKK